MAWTGNVGGGHFLRYFNGTNQEIMHKGMRTSYQSIGPNLTEVTYAGQTQDGKIDLEYGTSIYRSNDSTQAVIHNLLAYLNHFLVIVPMFYAQYYLLNWL